MPYAVPQYMRTRRGSPRVIATTLVLGWLAIYVSGVGMLHGMEKKSRSPFESALTLGTTYWGAHSSDAGSTSPCIGHLTVSLRLPDNKRTTEQPDLGETTQAETARSLSLDGEIRYLLFSKPASSSLRIDIALGETLQINKIRGSFKSGAAELIAEDDPESQTIAITAKSGNSENSFSLQRPTPMYLSPTKLDTYSIIVPPYLNRALTASLEKKFRIPFLLHELDHEEYSRCVSEVQQSSHSSPEGLVDAAIYLKMFNVSTNDAIVQLLTANGENHD